MSSGFGVRWVFFFFVLNYVNPCCETGADGRGLFTGPELLPPLPPQGGRRVRRRQLPLEVFPAKSLEEPI